MNRADVFVSGNYIGTLDLPSDEEMAREVLYPTKERRVKRATRTQEQVQKAQVVQLAQRPRTGQNVSG